MIKTLLWSSSEYETKTLIDTLKELNLNIQLILNWEDFSKEIKEQKEIQFIIINMDQLDTSQSNLLFSTNFLKNKISTLILFNKINDIDQRRFKKHPHLFLLEKPTQPQDLVGVAMKLLSRESIQQRMFRRFPVAVGGTVESYRSGKSTLVSIKNLSKGGALIESRSPFQRGEVVFIDILLDQLNRKHRLNARVVWVSDQSSDHPTLGVSFITQEDVYKDLLGKV